MFCEEDLTGSLVNSYTICPKKAWLEGRGVMPCRSNSDILMGKTLHRELKSTKMGNIEVDYISNHRGVVFREYKKSFAGKEAAMAQLLFYMHTYRQHIPVRAISGEIVSLETGEKIKVVYDSQKALDIMQRATEAIRHSAPPNPRADSFCLGCGQATYCL